MAMRTTCWLFSEHLFVHLETRLFYHRSRHDGLYERIGLRGSIDFPEMPPTKSSFPDGPVTAFGET